MADYQLRADVATYDTLKQRYDDEIANPPTYAGYVPPDPPTPPPVYTSRDLAEPEWLTTQYGNALAVPPSTVLTGPDGHAFAITPGDLAVQYVEVV